METFSSLSSIPPIIGSSTNSLSNNNETCLMRSTVKPSLNLNYPIIINPNKFKSVKFRKLKMRVEAVDEVSTVILEPAQVQVTWQIIVGTLAGVIPFVVAGIEFSKRIIAQRKCKVCGGSGLVLRDKKYYFRCPRCGGFLPWQSWRRFFSG
ncbi:uncharacterized protein LOC130808000 isoform X2 [Amaranthus tricolor]|uniref:uncharacterized protein LOC130808000 isoform X2 n=1 Tax=Amaranthus tricolor TaxID=29722 RepID=UPI00258A73D3|nr:uncharacterized protein LOC130808000 isoform X2 [Amaranthus tricolor]